MKSTPAVLLIAEFFPPDSEYVAFAERCRALAEELGSSGFRVSVLALRRSTKTPPAMSSASYSVLRRRRAASVFLRGNFVVNTIQRVWGMLTIVRVARETRARAIVISAHDPTYFVAAAAAGRIRGIPLVTDAQDSRIVLGASTSTHVRRRVKQWTEQFAMRRADRIWVPTHGLAELVHATYRIPLSHFITVPNGVRGFRFQVGGPHNGDSQLLLHIGGPRAYYDSATLIRAFQLIHREMPDTELVFLGVRDDTYTMTIRRLCSELGLGESVHFLPPIPPEAVPEFARRASLGVHTYALEPEYATTIGVKIMEYMAAGLPILHRGPRGGETWNLIENLAVGVCAESQDELATRAIALLRDPRLREAYAERGRAVAPEFEWPKVLLPAIEDMRTLT